MVWTGSGHDMSPLENTELNKKTFPVWFEVGGVRLRWVRRCSGTTRFHQRNFLFGRGSQEAISTGVWRSQRHQGNLLLRFPSQDRRPQEAR